ncbi:HAD family hydrolase [candidate division KSB1 bacterium]|nr:HAD family hydrolase [candidate division KSB1 bacterium]RQW04614.1 MAG: HAD family hydrolase [candidate division KSB1 bacterium]
MRYQQVIWDWNGTLIDDVVLCVQIINELLAKYKKPLITLARYQEVFDFPVQDYYQRIGFDFAETPFEVIGTEFMQHYWQRWQECSLQTGAREFFAELKDRAVPQVIVSAAETRLLRACVDHFQIDHFFAALHGLDHHYAVSKREVAIEYVAAAGCAPEEIVFIGDTLHDYDVAHAAGAACLLVARGHQPKQRLECCGAPVFDSLRQAREFLTKNNSWPEKCTHTKT